MIKTNELGAMLYIVYQNKTGYIRDEYAKEALRKYLIRKGLLFKESSTLFGHPTRKGFKVLYKSHFTITKYTAQIRQYKNDEPIRLIDKTGATIYV